MMKHLFWVLFLLANNTHSQTFEYVYRDAGNDSTNCYLKIIPKSKEIRGLLIRDYSSLPDTAVKSPYRLADLAAENHLLTLYTVTSNQFPEMFYNDSCIWLLDDMVAEVLAAHQIPKENIFMGGISASGTRALRYAQYCERGKSKYGHRVKGVFSVDSPLDLERFYLSVKNHRQNFKAGMLWEAELMSKVFPEKLQGSPTDYYQNYVNASVFTQSHPSGGNAKYLKNVHLIFFHEPDIDWWMNERGCSYYDFNSYDIAALVVKLRSLGNKNVELITTTGKGFDRKGNRNCHSWTIVDEGYLIKWILDRVE